MSEFDESPDALKLSDRATLKMLDVLERGATMSQRGLATQVGVALGMTNSLLKRAVRKGFVKVQQIPAKRYAYYVTPKGFSEKSQLVAQYLSSSLHFFRRAREEYSNIFLELKRLEHKRIVLFGTGELAEIALISAIADGIDILAIVQPGSNQSEFAGTKVVSSLDDDILSSIDAVVITHSSAPQESYDSVTKQIDADKVFVAPLLHVNTSKASMEEGEK